MSGPYTILGCGHLSVNEDENTGECMHKDCVDNREERSWLAMYEDYDTPSPREQMEVFHAEKQRVG